MNENTVEFKGYPELSEAIANMIGAIKRPYQAFAESGLIMFQDVMQHFKDESDPLGHWTPLSPVTLAMRRKNGRGAKILQDTGRLKNSITMLHGAAGAEVGTNVDYGVKHQFGIGVPTREFIWISEFAQQRILDRFVIQLKEA